MAATAARQAREVVALIQKVAAIHLVVLCQAADRRGAEKLSPVTRKVYQAVRAVSPYVEDDRELRDEIIEVAKLVQSGALSEIVEAG